jgi:outer membrane protein assembly factor BamD
MELIDLYYQQKNLLLAKDMADNFIHAYPFYERIDRVLYMRVLINMELGKQRTNLYGLINTRNSDQNYSYINKAVDGFSKLIKDYPNSRYVVSAENKIAFLRAKLASKDLSIMKFYFKKKAYKAVVNRARDMAKKYPNTLFSLKAMSLAVEANQKMKKRINS